ncbi:MAG: tripartite tricarboxylate transporter substrate binding protein, partial [Deltaproteobacteria bacterium]
MKKNKIFFIIAAVIMCTCFSQNIASAQQEKPFPTRQINYMICFDPGGQSDRVARLQQPLLDKILKQKVI